MHACASVEEKGVGLGRRNCFSQEIIRRVMSLSMASANRVALGRSEVIRLGSWRSRSYTLCRWSPEWSVEMYLVVFRVLVLERDRWGGLRRVGSMEWKTELISMSRKMARWSEGVTESNGSMAPRLIARSRSELAKM